MLYSIENKVDLLLNAVKVIQGKCDHRFFLLDVYKPTETLERGTFRIEKGIRACCLDCSKEVTVDMTEMCPIALEKWQDKKRRKVLLINCIVANLQIYSPSTWENLIRLR